MTIKIEASDPKGGKLFFRKYATGFGIVSEDGIISFSLNKNVDSAGSDNKAKAKIWVWNEENIVASIEKEIPFLTTSAGSVGGQPAEGSSSAFILEQNYPNPFNASTAIGFTLRENVRISLKIYDANGREVQVLKEGVHPPGVYRVFWDGKDKQGQPVPSGVYFYLLEGEDELQTKRMMMVR